MAGFLDRSFCRAYGRTCANHKCFRAMTDEVYERGRRWYGDDRFPYSTADYSTNCEYRIPMENGQ